MEFSGYELDSLSELPPLPQEFDQRNYSFVSSSAITPFDSLAPFPPSDFTFSDNKHQDLLQLQQHYADSLFLDSTLCLLNRHHLTESTRFQELFHSEDVATPFLQSCVQTTATAMEDTKPFLCLSPLDRHHLAESTWFDELFHGDDVATPFLHLPGLKSFEQTTTDAAVVENTKPFLSISPPVARHDEKRRKTNGSVVKSTFTISPPSSSHSMFGSDRRRKISEKIRSLEKLMPWEKKMNLATILKEAHKYIRFLQSQIASLQWMPLESVYYTAGEAGETDPLKCLTRQQILQVLANSPGARNVLYTNGVCVFSYEQLLSIQMMTQSARNL